MRESAIQREIFRIYGSHPKIRLWRANAGTALAPTASGRLRPVRMNIPGCPDLIGWIAPDGVFLGIEVKGPRGRLRPAQAAFRDRLEADGGVYILARSVEDVDKALKRLLL